MIVACSYATYLHATQREVVADPDTAIVRREDQDSVVPQPLVFVRLHYLRNAHTHTSFDQHFLAFVPGVSWQEGSFLDVKWRVQNKSVFCTSATASSRVLTIPA
jgi:hypothetical protein